MSVLSCTLANLLSPHTLPVNTVVPEQYIFYAEKPGLLQNVFLSSAVDILLAEPDSQVYYFSATELSDETSWCYPLRQISRFHPVNRHNACGVLKHLSKAVKTYSHEHLYIFAEDVERCIPREAWPLLQDMIAIPTNKVRVCLSTLSHFPHPSNIWVKPLSRHMITTCNGSPCQLIPSSDLPAKAQKLMQAEKKRKREEKRKNRKNTPPTLTQIILAVTAALLAFIASRLGG